MRPTSQARRWLLAGTVLTVMQMPTSPAALAASSGVQDLGATAAASRITATVWLGSPDQAGFDGAIAARLDPASPHYHEWMTDAQIAAHEPGPAAIAALSAALRAQGLTVSPRGGDVLALRVTGTADAIGRAFNTRLHDGTLAGTRFRFTTAIPAVSGAAGAIVAGVSGLDTIPRRPDAASRQAATGIPARTVALAKAANPLSQFTAKCFLPSQTQTRSTKNADGSTTTATVTGPVYLAAGTTAQTQSCGYTAAQLRSHYGLDAVYKAGFTGKGQTVVIVEEGGAPNLSVDLASYSKLMGLPAPTASQVTQVFPDGASPVPTLHQPGDAEEITQQAELIHAVAPDANIVVAVVPTVDSSSSDPDEWAYILDYAITHKLGQVITTTGLYNEQFNGPAVARNFDSILKKAVARGIAVNVSTGDDGDSDTASPYGDPVIPATSPYVTAVGGTSLDVPGANGPIETAWGRNQTEISSGGGSLDNPPQAFLGAFEPAADPYFIEGGSGGQSSFEAKPSWQKSLLGVGRMVPDIAVVANYLTAPIVVWPDFEQPGQSTVTTGGDTTGAAALFSGIWALANQAAGKSLGQAAPILYRLPPSAITDILPIPTGTANSVSADYTTGSTTQHYAPGNLIGALQPNGGFASAMTNSFQIPGTIASTDPTSLYVLGFGTDSFLFAGPGWDPATGLGAPNGLSFVNAAAGAR